MLQLKNIVKDYPLDNETTVHALKNVSLDFKENEFVAILGPSGCGKTTLLNIIGGLDQYTSGDLLIENISTKNYKDKDWDNYRNKRIGIVFQHYNLIPHLSVINNVEISMTLSGISKRVSKEKAKIALSKVGLEKEINKKPNQLSGGQMQRVAIARAIVNDPKIILADEPTGALDSETSIQIMDILKELSKDHLVIMVTHNKELADKYASRIVSIKDGEILSDIEKDNQDVILSPEIETPIGDTQTLSAEDIKKEKTSMSMRTALTISLQNLRTKKFRTVMTSIAGSIGIIGVALVLAVSNGFTNYINNMQSETLAQFPISVEEFGMNRQIASDMMTVEAEKFPSESNVIIKEPMTNNLHANDLSDEYIEYVKNMDPEVCDNVQFNHSIQMNIMTKSMETGDISYFSTAQASILETITSQSYWSELPASQDFILSQYDLIDGTYPTEENEMLLVVDKYNSITSTTLKALGIDHFEEKDNTKKISFKDIFDHDYKVVPNNEFFKPNKEKKINVKGIYLKPQYELEKDGLKLSKLTEYLNELGNLLKDVDFENLTPESIPQEAIDLFMKCINYIEIPEGFIPPKDINNITVEDIINMYNTVNVEKELISYSYPDDTRKKEIYNNDSIGKNLKIVGVIRPKESTMAPVLSYGVYYTQALTNYVLNQNSPDLVDKNGNHVIDPEEDIRCDIAKSYENCAYLSIEDGKLALHTRNIINNNDINDNFKKYLQQRKMLGTENYVSSISIYPKDFPSKKLIVAYLDAFNEGKDDLDKVLYTDLASALTLGVGTMVDIVSYVLIAFASISLVVSSVMIGIITYTSVIERTKEIGILRSVGARKKDIGRLFKAEAVIIGFISGLIGIALAYLICIPINMSLGMIYPEYGVNNIANLNPLHAVLLILLSAVLTYISSVIPSRIAAKKDPVKALATE